MGYEILSEYGKECVDKYYKNDTICIIDYKEKLEHDGYDSYGPQSNLWDLFILYTSKDSGEYVIDFVDWFHWEDWFKKDTRKGYTLYKTYNMDKLREMPRVSRKIIENKIIDMFN
jgi:hypothetical protein